MTPVASSTLAKSALAMTTYAVAIDVGGTFTDVILIANDGSGLWTTKAPSVPTDPSIGFFNAVEKILALAAVSPADLGIVLHGSTVATNAILQGNRARTGMLVSDGFKYVLEIGRAEVPRKENLYAWVKPQRPVAPRLIREVPERVRVDGQMITPLDERACRAATLALGARGVEAIAVVFLHAYANADNKQRAGAIIKELLPQVEISLSSDVLPVFREYERAVATTLNASVQPLVGRYVARLEDGLRARGVHAPVLIMKSNGGVFTPAQAARQSIEMALSGPAAGAKGAAHVAGLANYREVMTVDIGGTSTDVCLIRGGEPALSNEGEVGGFPIGVPMVDIHTIGAGGGSIAYITDTGGLNVGPRSAGADPGPACYARGGEEPTVTDANLVLGRIPPRLLDGEITLDAALAEQAIQRRIAQPLGLGVTAAARGIIALANNNMVGALKVVSVEKGYDPADFTLCAFGGAGPLHGGELFNLLGAARLFIPRFPGILCAMGLLATDQKYDFVRTRIQRAPHYDLDAINETFAALTIEAKARLQGEQVPADRQRLQRAADLRYERQGVELTVDLLADPLHGATLQRLIEDFHHLHERLYTFADRQAPVEIVNLRVTATGVMDRVQLPLLQAANEPSAPISEYRAVIFAGDSPHTVPVYRREALAAGHHIPGPAVVDQLDTTTVIFPRQQAEVDAHGNIIITRADQARAGAPPGTAQ